MTPDPRDRLRELLKFYNETGVGERAGMLHHDVCIKRLLEHAIAQEDRLDLLTVALHRLAPEQPVMHEAPWASHDTTGVVSTGECYCICDICERSRT